MYGLEHVLWEEPCKEEWKWLTRRLEQQPNEEGIRFAKKKLSRWPLQIRSVEIDYNFRYQAWQQLAQTVVIKSDYIFNNPETKQQAQNLQPTNVILCGSDVRSRFLQKTLREVFPSIKSLEIRGGSQLVSLSFVQGFQLLEEFVLVENESWGGLSEIDNFYNHPNLQKVNIVNNRCFRSVEDYEKGVYSKEPFTLSCSNRNEFEEGQQEFLRTLQSKAQKLQTRCEYVRGILLGEGRVDQIPSFLGLLVLELKEDPFSRVRLRTFPQFQTERTEEQQKGTFGTGDAQLFARYSRRMISMLKSINEKPSYHAWNRFCEVVGHYLVEESCGAIQFHFMFEGFSSTEPYLVQV